ncbi:MAG: 3-hydroxyacyl-CoA dehydrogenase NAD-binding domain-containing protein [Archaeoglobaceae archaeon]
MRIETVAVFGAGIMGHGIAEVCANAAYRVYLVDIDEKKLNEAMNKIRWSLEELKKKKKIKEEPEVIIGRIKPTTEFEVAAKEADVIIEAIPENAELKKDLFRKIGSLTKRDAIIATNTSTIPISELAESTGKPEKFIGLHFTNPPILLPYLEIIMGNKTSDETLEIAKKFAETLGQKFVVIKKDVPGFLGNRLNARIFHEAFRLLEKYSKEEIDATARYRIGMPMGVIELADFVGLDTVYYAGKAMMQRGFKMSPVNVLEEKVKKGETGFKTGKGFYEYPERKYTRVKIEKSLAYKVPPLEIIAPAINEAAWLIRNEVCTKNEIENAILGAMGWRFGLLELADRFGIDRVVEVLKKKKSETGLEEYEPDELLLQMLSRGELGIKTGKGFFDYPFEHIEFGEGSVIYEKWDGVAIITLNRPEVLNVLSKSVWRGIYESLERAEKDERIIGVVITGRGRAFCAGDDIREMPELNTLEKKFEWAEKYPRPTVNKILNYSKPIVMAVNGLAYGGGAELCLLADYVVASEDASFCVPEAKIAAIPPIASSIGVLMFGKKLVEWILSAEPITAKEAKEFGFINVVVPKEQVLDVALEFLFRLREQAPSSIRLIKDVLRTIWGSYMHFMRIAEKNMLLSGYTQDSAEGKRAFLEKRKPKWRE